MKKVVLFVIMSLALSQSALAWNEMKDIKGVTSDGNSIPTDVTTNTYYVFHGGCRTYNNNPALTEIWLYLTLTPSKLYNGVSLSNTIRTEMYLKESYGSPISILVCSYLRAAVQQQFSVKAILTPNPIYSSEFLVRSLDSSQLFNYPGCSSVVTDNKLLENFQTRE